MAVFLTEREMESLPTICAEFVSRTHRPPEDRNVKVAQRLHSVLEKLGHSAEPAEALYVLIENHPNSGELWVGKIGTKGMIQSHIDELAKNGDLDYYFAVLELAEKGQTVFIEDWGLGIDDGVLVKV